MTAYGRSSKSSSYGRWSVEVHSVNRKFLDISVQLPRDLLVFDIEIRKFLSSYVQRGQVTVKVSLTAEAGSTELVHKHVEQLKLVKKLYTDVAKELDLDASEINTLSFLLDQRQSVTVSESDQEEDVYRKELFSVLEQAILQYMKMKEVEGQALSIQIDKCLAEIVSLLEEIKLKAPEASTLYKQRLFDRISEVKELHPQDEERVMKEVMIYAEKIDIQEEITRLASHIDQFKKLLSSKEKSVGKTMDFLIQEMNREMNTICSKSDLLELSLNAMKMKGELEKIREQVQNIE